MLEATKTVMITAMVMMSIMIMWMMMKTMLLLLFLIVHHMHCPKIAMLFLFGPIHRHHRSDQYSLFLYSIFHIYFQTYVCMEFWYAIYLSNYKLPQYRGPVLSRRFISTVSPSHIWHLIPGNIPITSRGGDEYQPIKPEERVSILQPFQVPCGFVLCKYLQCDELI